MLNLGDLAGGFDTSIAHDVSADGSVVVGASDSTNGYEGFRWTEIDGMVGLGNLPGMEISHALGVSGDGSVVVGVSNNSSEARGFTWTESSGIEELDTLTGYSVAVATAISGDGSVIVGSQERATGIGFEQQAVRWAGGSVHGLGKLPGYDQSVAWGVSANGAVIVGWSDLIDGAEAQAFRWTEAQDMEGLGWLTGHTHSGARDASADGSVIVGESSVNDDSAAFLWTSDAGMRSLADVLTDSGVDVNGWTLTGATGVSDDGNTIVGWGVNPSGDHEGWIARLNAVPEPSTFALTVIGLLGFALRARSRHAEQ